MTQSPFPEPAKPNTMALWAMILGIVAAMLSLAIIGGFLGVLAVVLGIVGLMKPGRKGLSITGIVLGGISLPVAFVALLFWAGFFVAYSEAKSRARHAAAVAEITHLMVAVETFETDTGRYPTTREGLQALVTRPADAGPMWHPYLTDVPPDPWGHPYIYELNRILDQDLDYELLSAGPDGIRGTDDDIDIHTR